MSKFLLDLVTSRPLADRLLKRAEIQTIILEKTKGNSIVKSFNTSESLSNKLANKAAWEAKLDKANSDFGSLPEGPLKNRAKVDAEEYQWRLNRLALDDPNEDPEELVWSALEVAMAGASLPEIESFTTELTNLRGTLPE